MLQCLLDGNDSGKQRMLGMSVDARTNETLLPRWVALQRWVGSCACKGAARGQPAAQFCTSFLQGTGLMACKACKVGAAIVCCLNAALRASCGHTLCVDRAEAKGADWQQCDQQHCQCIISHNNGALHLDHPVSSALLVLLALRCVRYLGEAVRAGPGGKLPAVILLKLLITWLHGCPAAVDAFLRGQPHLPLLVDGAGGRLCNGDADVAGGRWLTQANVFCDARCPSVNLCSHALGLVI